MLLFLGGRGVGGVAIIAWSPYRTVFAPAAHNKHLRYRVSDPAWWALVEDQHWRYLCFPKHQSERTEHMGHPGLHSAGGNLLVLVETSVLATTRSPAVRTCCLVLHQTA